MSLQAVEAALPTVRLTRPIEVAAPTPKRLDPTQAAVVDTRRGEGPVVVLGAPGTGKTTTLVEAVVARVERDGVPPDGVLVLAPTRVAAGALRERITARLRRTVREPLARTPHAYAFGLLRRRQVLDGDPPPRLLSGPEQDRVLADLLAGHTEGVGYAPAWPAAIDDRLRTLRAFRGELRDLLMRAVERGLAPSDLERLGRRFDRADWVAASEVFAEYLDVTSLATPGAYDPAGIVDAAGYLLTHDEELLRAERDQWQLVAVEDAQELTTAAARLVNLLAGPGRDLLLVGDPDAATQTFRGARPRLLVEAIDRLRSSHDTPARVLTLGTAHRQHPQLRAVSERITARISSSGMIEHRRARCEPADVAHATEASASTVQVHVLSSAAQEAAFAAQLLRRAHLEDKIPWRELAVVVRSTAGTAPLRRAFVAAGVPFAVPGAEVSVRDEPAVSPLRLALSCALDPQLLTADTAVDLLTGPIGGADVLALRRLRQRLRQEDAMLGGHSSSDDLLLAALRAGVTHAEVNQEETAPQPLEVSVEPDPIRRVAVALAAAARAIAEPGATAHSVLWALWEATGLGEIWQRTALAGGPGAARADRDLDAVMALFEAAARYTERLPRAGAAQFLEYLQGQDLPEDTLAERAPAGDSVSLLTATGAAGREWDLVVITGVQERVWPDLRLRSSLLGAQELADLIDRDVPPTRGVAADAQARRMVLDDELRLFLVATSRARHRLVVTAVSSADELPSPFLDLVDARDEAIAEHGEAEEIRPQTEVPRALTLSALVAELRAAVTDETASVGRRDLAAQHLATLARAGVTGAHPQDWYGAAATSSVAPLSGPHDVVRVSPSQVDTFRRCPLRWLLQQAEGSRPPGVATQVGTLIHEIAEAVPDGDLPAMKELLESRFPQLGLRPGWISDTERAKAERMLVKFSEYVRLKRADGRKLVSTELVVDVLIGRARVKGSVDRLEIDGDGHRVVVDLKTGSSRVPKAELAHHPQLGVYQAALEAQGDVSGGAELVQLGGSQRSVGVQAQAPLRHDDDPDWAVDLIAQTADGMAANSFLASVNESCRTCASRRSCPLQLQGRQVSS